MVNTDKLRGLIVEKRTSIAALASSYGISAYQLGKKINNTAEMSLKEAEFLQRELGIPDDDFAIFFYSKSCKTQRLDTA